MTEADWLACSDPTQMWGWLVRTGRVNHRRCRRVFTACCELIRLGKVRPQTLQVWEASSDNDPDAGPDPIALKDLERHLLDATGGALHSCDEDAGLVTLLRDIFGDPFRPASFDPARRTPAALFLARAAEAELPLLSSRLEPVLLLLLADALEEAGCGDEAVLSHLRSGGPHVRGCWALDLVLGKQ